MIKQFVESLENPRRPLLAPNYWMLKRLGMVLPKNVFGKVLFVTIHEIGVFFVISQYIELYEIRLDLDLVLTNLKISMLSVVCVVKVNTYLFWQQSWIDVLNYVTEADKFERNDHDETKEEIVSAYTLYSRRVTYCYWVLVFTTFLTTVLQPLMFYLTSESMRDGLRNGTVGFPHIFSSWVPLDKERAPGCWLTVLWHVLICAYGASVLAAYDANAVVIMVFIGGKLDLLRVRCRQALGALGTRGGATAVSDRDFDAVLKQLHHMHMQLIKYSRVFNSLLSPVMFFYMVVCTLMLCASAYQLTSSNNTAQKLIMVEYLVFGVTQLFVFCWHSNDVLVKSELVSLGPYESQWWVAPVAQRRALLLLAGQLRLQNIFTAGPFTDLTLATFVTILKGSYSYYTLINK